MITIRGIWYGLITGMEWLARQAGGLGWFLAGAAYGCLVTYWLVAK